ncbi:type III pantothenate kinase [Anaerocolumna aminovalerica]|jgi:type III pantothenate kinase|uniref:Type III pantothenate kinase n=1 Tax=Anaerocolumna aminovalerica TaxID=1527 RepID=A0A1I5H0K8_9FIRM|nr:type III pantothenate kinase [Anaerocolumna aminovalerica]MBU5332816.1 type III pantothenate kinase [Anaerocolumna aminovalerica]MDU6265925.1 type III pantothenate kinase [Anaerocolumna aminovalerica]SFO41737.1 pantothenate kinase [Anaerocolumna aminovalerica]
MLLVIDVGNTNVTLGIFKEDVLISNFRITTRIARTSDEYGIIIYDLLKIKGIDFTQIKAAAIASVVPGIMHSLKSAIIKYLNLTPFVIGTGTKTGIKIVTPNPKEIGSDRIVDAVAAYDLYGGPLIVIDFGTATTYDLITEDGSFLAGITSPGIRICADALWQQTARLPEIEIKKPDSILAKETISSMQAGLVYGYIGQTEYIVKKVIEESGIKGIKVIATGGLGKIIADETDAIQIFDDSLTLQGIRLIYNKNRM